MTFGDWIRINRKSHHWTQEQLASDICERSYISLIEHNKAMPPADLVRKLLEKLELQWGDMQAILPLPSARNGAAPASLLTTCRMLWRQGNGTAAFHLANELWWEAIEIPQDAQRHQEVAQFLLALVPHDPAPALVGGWLQAAWHVYLMRGDPLAKNIGLLLQHWLFGKKRWEESWGQGRLLRKIFPETRVALAATIGVGSAYWELGQFESATFYYEEARNIWSPHAGWNLKATIHHGLSATSMSAERWNVAAQHAQEAYRLYQTVRADAAYQALQNLGIIRIHQNGSLEEGLALLDRVAEHYAEQERWEDVRLVLEDCMEFAASHTHQKTQLYQRQIYELQSNHGTSMS